MKAYSVIGAIEILETLPPTLTQLAIGDNFTHSDTAAVSASLAKLIERNPGLRSLSLVGGEVRSKKIVLQFSNKALDLEKQVAR